MKKRANKLSRILKNKNITIDEYRQQLSEQQSNDQEKLIKEIDEVNTGKVSVNGNDS